MYFMEFGGKKNPTQSALKMEISRIGDVISMTNIIPVPYPAFVLLNSTMVNFSNPILGPVMKRLPMNVLILSLRKRAKSSGYMILVVVGEAFGIGIACLIGALAFFVSGVKFGQLHIFASTAHTMYH